MGQNEAYNGPRVKVYTIYLRQIFVPQRNISYQISYGRPTQNNSYLRYLEIDSMISSVNKSFWLPSTLFSYREGVASWNINGYEILLLSVRVNIREWRIRSGLFCSVPTNFIKVFQLIPCFRGYSFNTYTSRFIVVDISDCYKMYTCEQIILGFVRKSQRITATRYKRI